MATATRQPFAPLDGARLQTLTSLKNRQNALPSTNGKRKADRIDTDDSENVDPTQFAKRSKASNDSNAKDAPLKPTNFILTKASSSEPRTFAIPSKPIASVRRTLQPRSPAAKFNIAAAKSSPLYSPAGRSPTRSKRAGATSRRRTVGPYARVDPPSFGLGSGSAAPFSLDAALKGTIPSYASRPAVPLLSDPERDLKGSLDFTIHEDTPEEEMNNMLQHSTCVLDISSDEESEVKMRRERAEGRDKENVPPVDDVSQTSARRAARVGAEDMVVEKERVALGEMKASDFYPDGCDETSVIIIPADEEEEPERAPETGLKVAQPKDTLTALETQQSIDALIAKPVQGSSKAAVLEPIEGTGESFELWESGSAQDETETATSS